MPVSYTHLDVYKRQGVYREERGVQLFSCYKSIGNAAVSRPDDLIFVENLCAVYLKVDGWNSGTAGPSDVSGAESDDETLDSDSSEPHPLLYQVQSKVTVYYTVSYTHLDVYKRQIIKTVSNNKFAFITISVC